MAKFYKKGLLGLKVGMTRLFMEDGAVVPVTAVHVGQNVILGTRNPEKHGYAAVQLGYNDRKRKASRTPKAEAGFFKKAGVDPQRFVCELRLADPALLAEFEAGEALDASIFQAGDKIDIMGTSKGKGTAGVMKRHHFSGFPRTHGTHEYFRHGGSIGTRKPQHTRKGMRMSGRMGFDTVTEAERLIVKIDPEEQLIYVKGSIPGPKRGLVMLKGR